MQAQFGILIYLSKTKKPGEKVTPKGENPEGKSKSGVLGMPTHVFRLFTTAAHLEYTFVTDHLTYQRICMLSTWEFLSQIAWVLSSQ